MINKENGGAKRNRTADPLHAMQVLSQLSYSPMKWHSSWQMTDRQSLFTRLSYQGTWIIKLATTFESKRKHYPADNCP